MRTPDSSLPVQAILFDVDGTLLNGLEMIVAGLGDAFEKYGDRRPSDDEILALIGTPLRHQMTLFGCSPQSEEELDEMIDYTIERYEVNNHLEYEFSEAVESLVAAEKAGIKIALVTSRNTKELQILSQRFSAWNSIHAPVCASDVVNAKPHPESAFLAMQQLGVKPEESVLIGDSIFDLRCAKSAGIRCGAALYGAGKKEDLLAEAPDYIFTTPQDLLEWVLTQIESRHAKEEDTRQNDFQSRSRG